MGRISDATNIRTAFIVPLHVCYVYIFYFAVDGYKPGAAHSRNTTTLALIAENYESPILLRSRFKRRSRFDRRIQKKYHEKIWPEVTQSLKDSGIEDLEIYLLGTRMFMIMEVNQSFSFEKKAKADEQDPKKVQAWGAAACGNSSKRCLKRSPAKNGCAWNVFLSSKLSWRRHIKARVARVKP